MAPVMSPKTPQPRCDFTTDSPNYFGLAVDGSSSPAHQSDTFPFSTTTWSPASGKVRSVAAQSPQRVPLDQHPDLDAFRRQAEHNTAVSPHQGAFAPTTPSHNSHSGKVTPPAADFGRRHSSRSSIPTPLQKPDLASILDASAGSRSPKRLHSEDSSSASERPRRGSPAFFNSDGSSMSTTASSPPRLASDKQPRLSFTNEQHSPPHLKHPRSVPSSGQEPANAPAGLSHYRAETLPETLSTAASSGEPDMVTPQHIVNILESSGEEILLLDLRVSTQYTRSRISGALSLCVPTTLLKRPSHNTRKLAETFKDGDQRNKFEKWPKCNAIVVYDKSSSQLKEAGVCVNVLKKFSSEGWSGTSYIIRGGFDEFASLFPSHVDSTTTGPAPASSTNLSLRPSTPSVAPVIGGCPIPASKNAANPFFGNIRQNMDLIGGVGQLPVKKPEPYDPRMDQEMPRWLKRAADTSNDGKFVADRFLHIERREQKRMQDALSGNVTYGTPAPDAEPRIQIAGIEKGSKNRYNNIWPFEHTRVKLQGVPTDGCDYVNANLVQTSISPKKYVATQGPIPATFNDFWKMVWQQGVRVIVMLTAETEGGQVKAHNYWNQRHYGPLRLNHLKEQKATLDPARIQRSRHRPSLGARKRSPPTPSKPSEATEPADMQPTSDDQPYVIVRKFTLSHEGEPFERMREITQLQYSSWPDFGVPTHPAHLLGLVQQCDAVVRQNRTSSGPQTECLRPVLVHCSAGCGRTGTFCTLDTVVDALRRMRQERNHNEGQAKTQDQPANALSQEPEDDVFFKASSARNGNEGQGVLDDAEEVDLIEKTVEEFRLQRLSMVQSLRQYVLCYEALMEWFSRELEPVKAAGTQDCVK